MDGAHSQIGSWQRNDTVGCGEESAAPRDAVPAVDVVYTLTLAAGRGYGVNEKTVPQHLFTMCPGWPP